MTKRWKSMSDAVHDTVCMSRAQSSNGIEMGIGIGIGIGGTGKAETVITLMIACSCVHSRCSTTIQD
jgi:hypothetical protein